VNSIANELAHWAYEYEPTADDVELANRSLVDTVCTIIAAKDRPTVARVRDLSDGARWGVAAHIDDYDDLHVESTTHISAVCVPAILGNGGNARSYLAGAGVMARLGVALGWPHYSAGWHATTTVGAPGAAVSAAVALGLDAQGIMTAMALSIPAAGGVRSAFGTDAKALQVGFAAEAGTRAAYLAASGLSSNPAAVDQWFDLMGGNRSALDAGGPAIPGGLAVKLYPCCYALQRPIGALSSFGGGRDTSEIDRIVVRTSASSIQPLIYHHPTTGLEAKFSLEYAIAASLLDNHPGLWSFTDEAVSRSEAQRLIRLVEIDINGEGESLLDGVFEVDVCLGNETLTFCEEFPLGSPQRPLTISGLEEKASSCLAGTSIDASMITWQSVPAMLHEIFEISSSEE
jgi:2-methylcitrate dehydratase PrpD